MRKRILFIGAISLLSLASCKKDWTCVCTSSAGSSSSLIVDKTKSDAEAECNEGDGTVLGYTVECEIQ